MWDRTGGAGKAGVGRGRTGAGVEPRRGYRVGGSDWGGGATGVGIGQGGDRTVCVKIDFIWDGQKVSRVSREVRGERHVYFGPSLRT